MLRPLSSSMRAAANTPAEPVGARVTRFPTGISLPRYQGGSASASCLSRPARRSLALRPAWSLSRPGRPVASECFRRCRCLHHPLRLLPAGATVAGRDSHPLKNGAFHGAPDKGGYVAFSISKVERDRRVEIISGFGSGYLSVSINLLNLCSMFSSSQRNPINISRSLNRSAKGKKYNPVM